MLQISSTMQTRGEMIQSMQKNTVLSGLSQSVYQYIADLSEVWSFDPGEAIVHRKEPSDAFYIVIQGQACVILEGNKEVGILGASDGFGEIGLLLNTPRSATIVAKEPVTVMRTSQANFMQCFQRFADFGLAMSKVLAGRLSETLALVPKLGDGQSLPSNEIISMLPLPFLQRFRVLPLAVNENTLQVGFVDEPQANIIDRIKQFLPSMEIEVLSIDLGFLDRALHQVNGLSDNIVEEAEEDQHFPQKLKALLELMVAEGASDLHLSAHRKPFWRVDGSIRPLADVAPLRRMEAFELLKPLMRDECIEEFEASWDTDFAIALEDYARFRVNLFRDNNGAGAVLRLIPSKILTVGQLGLPRVLLDLAALPKGLVLVTGATGSGKSTTLAAMIDHLNRTQEGHIITLEDPIEFVHPSQRCLVNQREIGAHTNGFKSALRAALRQDPDIVLVGELRDQETVQLALEVANTGHLVFGTLHTMNAISSIDRIIDMFPSDQQNQIRSTLAEVLKGVVSQTLCKRRSGGRIAALEVLVVNQAVSGQIRRGQTNQIETAMQTNKALGNQLLRDALTGLVRQNLVDYDEALNKSIDKEQFAKIFGKVYRS